MHMSQVRHVIDCLEFTTNRELHLLFLFLHFTAVDLRNWNFCMMLCFVTQDEEGKGKKSILDVDPEVQAIMEMTGKTMHSQGLREPEEDQEQ